MTRFLKSTLALCAAASCVLLATDAFAQRQMEKLGRGVIAIRTSTNSTSPVYVGWRLWGTDPAGIGFNLYRAASGTTNLLNGSPITNSCNFVDATANLAVANVYFVRPVTNGVEQADSVGFTLPAGAPTQQFISIPITQPPGSNSPPSGDGDDPGGPYAYNANDCSAADVDGDGEYEIILKWDPTNSKDNSQSGWTGPTYLDCYKLNGTLLWRINLGPNIRSGAHYMDFMVFDYDGDGKAEVMCRTAPGAKDALGNYVGGVAKWQNANGPHPTFNDTDDYRFTGPNGTNGYVLAGPEFLSVFNGLTGAEMATATYYPKRDQDLNDDNPSSSRINTIWGDGYGNRIDRFLAGVAYLDGRRPSAIFCRGYYTRAFLVAWDWRNGQLTRRWVFDSNDGTPGNTAYRGQGAHSLTIGDVDGDGKDEITYGAAAIDDDGKGLYSTGLGHGDAEHLSDMDPDRPGLEVWMVHEDPGSYGPNGLEFRDAKNGALIFGVDGQGADVGRGVAIDIDPRFRGYEMWGSRGGLMSATGVQISGTKPGQQNFAIWWDADTIREILDGTTITKWNHLTSSGSTLLSTSGLNSNNGTKSTPCLSADLFGDWREEVIWRTSGNTELRIFTTTIVATNRLYTLMHDPQYRCAIAWQNTGYNQPPHPGFNIGPDMYPQPVAPMSDADLVWNGGGGNTWGVGFSTNWFTNRVWMTNYTAAMFQSGNSVLFDIGGSNNSSINLAGALAPSAVTVLAPKDYVFGGSGSLTGAMSLVKGGAGKLTIDNTNTYTGPTLLTEGTLRINGSLDRSPLIAQGSLWGTRLTGSGRLGQGATFLSGAVIMPGDTNVTRTLTISNQLSELGRALNQFDLSNDPTGVTKTNDRIDVVGNLTLSGTNIIQINQLDAFLGGGVYTLISYSGTLTGGLTNLVLSGNFVQPVALTNPPGAIALVSVVPAAPPTAPSGLTATAVGAFQVNLGWTDNSADEIEFLIERSTGNTNSFAQIAVADENINTYSDLGAAPLTTYYYRVRGTNLAGAGPYSNIASATTVTPPTSLTWRGDGLTNTWDLTGTANWIDGATLVVYSDGTDITFDQNGSNSPNINLVGTLQPDSVTVNATKSYTFGGAGSLAGPMALVKSGSGGLTINTVNSYAGGVTLNSGTLTLGAAGAQGSGPLILKGGTLALSGSGGPATYGNSLRVSNTVSITVSGSGNNNQSLSGTWTASTNTVNVSIGSGGTFSLQGNMTAFSGTLALGSSAGTLRFYTSPTLGSSLAAFNLGSGSVSLVNRDGSTTVRLGALTGGSGTFVRGRSSATGGSGSNYEIGGRNTNCTFNGQIVNGGDVTRITKVGAAMFTLVGSNSFTGPTAVNVGTLLVNGNNTNATGPVTVALGATLGGFGVIGGPTTVDGVLAPGSNSISRLTFATNLTFGPGGTAIFELNLTPFTNDVARVLGTVTFDGTLSVANVGVELLEAGDNFRLFDATNYSGTFNDFALPVLDEGLAWKTTQLNVDGRLWVVKTTPPVIASTVRSGNNLVFTGNGGTPGWTYYVLTCTNAASPLTDWIPIATNQFNGTGGFAVTNGINPSSSQRFYLLRVP